MKSSAVSHDTLSTMQTNPTRDWTSLCSLKIHEQYRFLYEQPKRAPRFNRQICGVDTPKMINFNWTRATQHPCEQFSTVKIWFQFASFVLYHRNLLLFNLEIATDVRTLTNVLLWCHRNDCIASCIFFSSSFCFAFLSRLSWIVMRKFC